MVFEYWSGHWQDVSRAAARVAAMMERVFVLLLFLLTRMDSGVQVQDEWKELL